MRSSYWLNLQQQGMSYDLTDLKFKKVFIILETIFQDVKWILFTGLCKHSGLNFILSFFFHQNQSVANFRYNAIKSKEDICNFKRKFTTKIKGNSMFIVIVQKSKQRIHITMIKKSLIICLSIIKKTFKITTIIQRNSKPAAEVRLGSTRQCYKY